MKSLNRLDEEVERREKASEDAAKYVDAICYLLCDLVQYLLRLFVVGLTYTLNCFCGEKIRKNAGLGVQRMQTGFTAPLML